MPVTAAQRRARQNLRLRRWRSMDAYALLALKGRLQARGINPPSILWERLGVEVNKLRDPRYRAHVMAKKSVDGAKRPRAHMRRYDAADRRTP